MTDRRRVRWVVGSVVLLLHLAALWAWPPGGRGGRDAGARPAWPATTVRLLPNTAPAEPNRPAVVRRDSVAPAARRRDARVPEPVSPTAIAASPQGATIGAPAAEPAASGPVPLDLRLRLPRGAVAERGGLTEAPDSMRRAALNDPRSNVATDPTQVLPRAVASSAKGDCLKGEYAGGGMGLLSLPFLALAAVRDACKPSR